MRPAGETTGFEGLVGRRIVGVSWFEGEAGAGLRLQFTDFTEIGLLVKNGRLCFKWLSGIEGTREQYRKNWEEFVDFLGEQQFRTINLPADAEVFKFNYEMCHLFIDLWSQAGSSPQYVKSEWGRFGQMLDALGIYPESSVWECSTADKEVPPSTNKPIQ